MTKQEALNILLNKVAEILAIGQVHSVFGWDSTTDGGAPVSSFGYRGNAMAFLSGESYKRIVADDTREAFETLEGDATLTAEEAALARGAARSYKLNSAIPKDELEKFIALTTEADNVWRTAKEKSDYASVEPYYAKIFDFSRRVADWRGYENHPYNALLDEYEIGLSVAALDKFFDALRLSIVPLLRKITDSGIQPKKIDGSFPIENQRLLTRELVKTVGFDTSRGRIGETVHPYCMLVNPNDVRIAVAYHEDDLLSGVYSTIHECGHAIYDQNVRADLYKYGMHDMSMGLHESQSRFLENIIGRSRAFAPVLLELLRSQFDSFKKWSADDLYSAVNIAKPSLVRIEADELTYSLHVMVRYEIEKKLVQGEVSTKDLPELWNAMYEEYLGVRPPTHALGALQDSHWAGGAVGYFPTYALGTAYSAQLLHAMEKTVDWQSGVAAGDLSCVIGWLKQNVHQDGSLYMPEEVLQRATGESFNPTYYTSYLSEKFTKLYRVSQFL
ncbi:MAG: carboxypeptidase M32 [Oscillospiraceae bacterium]|jgi:carboxypeptidase Taq|nr:carboxypeptidase M32 [Oscillospiraceae bacterium]